MSLVKQTPWIKTTCAYCGVGCGIEAKPNTIGELEVRGDKEHPANYGRLCSKGLALGETVGHQGRLLEPTISGQVATWDSALNHVATQFSQIIAQHGPDSVAFYVSGQILTEDYYLANKLMKGFIGSGNIDTNSRLCMSSTVVGHQRAFGTDTMPGCYSDLDQADIIVITGSNLAWCHPVLYQRIKAAKQQRPELFVVVIDPRVTATCEISDLHLALQPGSDVALFNGLLRYLAEHGALDAEFINEHTVNFDSTLAAARLDGDDLSSLAASIDIDVEKLKLFYQRFAETDKVVTLFSQGVNQSSCGSDKVNSIINCHLATGRIGKPGSGPMSLTGQPNAMGGREVGGMASALAAHMNFDNEDDHQAIADYWQTNKLARRPGLKAVELFDAIEAGTVKAVWIMATNPVVSLPDANRVKQALLKCPLVVVSDCVADTDTTRCADVLLPAQGWSEKSGTVTNSERRISRQRRLLASPGEAKPDWWIIKEVAIRMGFEAAFTYQHEAQIFREYAAMTGLNNHDGQQRNLDLSGLCGISDQDYNELKPQQWPLRKVDQQIEHKRLFSDGQFFTPSGRARFVGVNFMSPASDVCGRYPLSLNTGRIRDQWHTMSRTGLSARLAGHSPEPFVDIHAADAARYGLQPGGIARLSSRWGNVLARVSVSADVAVGQPFMPIHWADINASRARVSSLIGPERDRVSGQPEFKFTAVKIEAWHYASEALVLADTLARDDVEYWVRQKIPGSYLYRIASPLEPHVLAAKLEADLIAAGPCSSVATELAFSSVEKAEYRHAWLAQGNLKNCHIVAASLQTADYEWIEALYGQTIDGMVGASILSGIAAPHLMAGRQICACKNVGEKQIRQCIEDNEIDSVEQLGRLCLAGTGCGSCVPELESMLKDEMVPSPKAASAAVLATSLIQQAVILQTPQAPQTVIPVLELP